MNKIRNSLREAIKDIGLKDNMTISFHHHLREGDSVILMVLEEIRSLGIKGLVLTSSSIMTVHEDIVDFIKDGTIAELHTSGLKGRLARYVLEGKLDTPVVFRSHGGRARAVSDGELTVDVAFIAASQADIFGNATGTAGKNAFGSMGYAMWEAMCAKKVVVITDELLEDVLEHVSIPQYRVDLVVTVNSIGDKNLLAKGSLTPKVTPRNKIIAEGVARVILNSKKELSGATLQMGSGGISLQVIEYLADELRKKNIKLKFVLGGITKSVIELFENGFVETLLDVQSFTPAAAQSILKNKKHKEIDVSWYANPQNHSCAVNFLDFAVLSALEVDINWNVNVLTTSLGEIRGAIGGHQDVAEGAKITIIPAPLIRGRIPIVVDKVKTLVTSGKFVDVLVTDFGIAVNPKRVDIKDSLERAGIKLASIEELYNTAISLTGKPDTIRTGDKVVGVVQTRRGGIADYIYEKRVRA